MNVCVDASLKLLITNVDIMKRCRKALWKAQLFAQWRHFDGGLNYDGNSAQIVALNQFVAHMYCSFIMF